MTTDPTFATDLAPYRKRATALTARLIAGDHTAMTDTDTLLSELEERFCDPLLRAYKALPFETRAGGPGIDTHNRDAIGAVVHAFAGVAELSLLHDIAMDWSDPNNDPPTPLEAAGLRIRAELASSS